eukprot:2362891-Rhodomonas_salina.2
MPGKTTTRSRDTEHVEDRARLPAIAVRLDGLGGGPGVHGPLDEEREARDRPTVRNPEGSGAAQGPVGALGTSNPGAVEVVVSPGGRGHALEGAQATSAPHIAWAMLRAVTDACYLIEDRLARETVGDRLRP